jgi:hypothetical protein
VVGGLSSEVAAVATLWTAAKAAGAPRPLEDFLKCRKAESRRVRKAAWRLWSCDWGGRLLRTT